MATNGQSDNNGSIHATQYLFMNSSQDEQQLAPNPNSNSNNEQAPAAAYHNPNGQQRPTINVPIDLGYSLQRFVDSSALKPLHHFAATHVHVPLTEDQSRARMTALMLSAAATLAPTLKKD
ncbi:hypothetical protein F5Y16DRAFT_387554 [Xylariaceae sp. FL0255]|nr:hypothetical protein F5Y16DRAFT_387554 [Xylariaceae sp. FL0255]